MQIIHQIKSWLRRLTHSRKSESELDDEISVFFDSMIERRVSQA